ncbi:Lysine--tRNA ligase, heat inducible [Candidatus Providencia siddallii]|uniref:Lysine--tRNA ligase n=1 Tax=Candidatus Providencia siddallii TaxID=1715285 RepID=A0A0M6W9Y1_9GAMM|nr:Lysine--tRNA ligase, heat inducible [Candidatus Providencia siddallii]
MPQNKKFNNLNDEILIRKKKLDNIRKKGIPFPNNFRKKNISNELHIKYCDKSIEELKKLYINVSIAGRIVAKRVIGKASFAVLQDSGGRIQIYVSYNSLKKDLYEKEFKTFDLSDILGVNGILFKTKTGELTVHCYEIYLLTKALRPLPNKFHGLTNQETRYRQRYLDLISNDSSRNTFIIRSKIFTEIRKFMSKQNFIEVETPLMQTIPGGATARPFVTHHNALNIDLYLRIAPELYLKRLIIGGFERIFEINRSFRNENLSTHHNPEFTMMELYIAYSDYHELMELIEDLFNILSQTILGSSIVCYGKQKFDFSKPFDKMTMKEAICKYYPEIKINDLDCINKISVIAKSIDIKIDNNCGLGYIQCEIFEKIVEKKLIQPVFITEYPTEVSPLARHKDDNPFVTERFEFFINGHEIANGFSELNDSEEQAKRFAVQSIKKGNDEITFSDKDYITALEYGLPPTAGLGIGIDRLIMLLTNNHTIRDVILFPILRSQ